jgi:hypothetical protein
MADSPQAARASYCERKGRSPRQDGSENTRLNFPVMAFPRDSVEVGRHPQVCKNLQALKGLLRLVPNDFDKTASVIRFHYEGVGQRIEDRPRDNGGVAINGSARDVVWITPPCLFADLGRISFNRTSIQRQ